MSNANCTIEQDYRDAARVCGELGLPLVELDFVRTYYTRVFEPFLESLRRGCTPNPDLACNRVVKFDALLGACRRDLGADVLATGHYARIARGDGDEWRLLRALDSEYDQTYFLSSVNRAALGRVLFPLGELTKEQVRELAREFGLSRVSEKKSSTGICFIGKRNFGAFVEEYLPPRPGVFIDVDDVVGGSGEDHDDASARPVPLGPCRNIHSFTYGQNAGIGGLDRKAFVVGKDLGSDVVYVCRDREHPSLYTSTALVEDLHWISKSHERVWETSGRLSGVQYKARYREPQRDVSEMVMEAGNGVPGPQRPCPSRLWGIDGEDLKGDDLELPKPSVWIKFAEPAYAITPGQYIVLYDGEVCVASARIVCPGS